MQRAVGNSTYTLESNARAVILYSIFSHLEGGWLEFGEECPAKDMLFAITTENTTIYEMLQTVRDHPRGPELAKQCSFILCQSLFTKNLSKELIDEIVDVCSDFRAAATIVEYLYGDTLPNTIYGKIKSVVRGNVYIVDRSKRRDPFVSLRGNPYYEQRPYDGTPKTINT